MKKSKFIIIATFGLMIILVAVGMIVDYTPVIASALIVFVVGAAIAAKQEITERDDDIKNYHLQLETEVEIVIDKILNNSRTKVRKELNNEVLVIDAMVRIQKFGAKYSPDATRKILEELIGQVALDIDFADSSLVGSDGVVNSGFSTGGFCVSNGVSPRLIRALSAVSFGGVLIFSTEI